MNGNSKRRTRSVLGASTPGPDQTRTDGPG